MNIKKKTVFVILMLSIALVVTEIIDDDEEYNEPPLRLRDIPDKYYDDLMKEMPDLQSVLVEYMARRRSPPFNETRHKRHVEETTPNPQEPTNSSMKSGRRIYQVYPWDWPGQTAIWWSRNWVGKKNFFRKKIWYPITSCFWCGMNITYFIPTTTMCHDAFESNDFRMRALQRFFRGKCYYVNPVYVNMGHILWYDFHYMGTFQGWNNMIYGSYYESYTDWIDKRRKEKWGFNFYWNYGLKRNYFGQYIGGCFKRYLDVGTLYTQRGCKHYWPIRSYGPNSISHRFRRLEYVLRFQKEGCVSSNHASLTPFNRGISLYARYHVCVCEKRYCNRGARAHIRLGVLLIVSLSLSRIFI